MWCWWCCHPYETQTRHLPFKYDSNLKQFKTMGNFCSWSCVKAYNLDKGGCKYGEIQSYIVMMIRQARGKYESYPYAPKREALKVFGGKLSIEEFRRCREPPFIKMPNEIYIECVSNAYVMKKDDALQDETGLKLRREKPLKRNESSLEKALKKKSGIL